MDTAVGINTHHPHTYRLSEEARQKHLTEIRELTYLLDNAFRIPFINYRFGIDPILGLVPVIGDFTGLGLSGYLIYRAARMGAPVSLLLRMALNSFGDAVLGSIPVLGTLVDIVWKANTRNIQMLERFLAGTD